MPRIPAAGVEARDAEKTREARFRSEAQPSEDERYSGFLEAGTRALTPADTFRGVVTQYR